MTEEQKEIKYLTRCLKEIYRELILYQCREEKMPKEQWEQVIQTCWTVYKIEKEIKEQEDIDQLNELTDGK